MGLDTITEFIYGCSMHVIRLEPKSYINDRHEVVTTVVVPHQHPCALVSTYPLTEIHRHLSGGMQNALVLHVAWHHRREIVDASAHLGGAHCQREMVWTKQSE